MLTLKAENRIGVILLMLGCVSIGLFALGFEFAGFVIGMVTAISFAVFVIVTVGGPKKC